MTSDFHDDNSKVRSAQIEGEKLSALVTTRQFPHIGGEALDAGLRVRFLIEAAVEGLAHALLHLMNVVVVDHEVAAIIFGLSPPIGDGGRLIRLDQDGLLASTSLRRPETNVA